MQETVNVIILRELSLSYLSKPTIDYHFTDSSGFIQELLTATGVIKQNKKLCAQEIFDIYHISGSWNKHTLGSLAFYGRSVLEIGHVALLLDGHTVISADLSADEGIRVKIRPLNFRSGLVAIIRPSYAQIGCP